MRYFIGSPDAEHNIGIPDNYTDYYCVALGYKSTTHQVQAPNMKNGVVTYIN